MASRMLARKNDSSRPCIHLRSADIYPRRAEEARGILSIEMSL